MDANVEHGVVDNSESNTDFEESPVSTDSLEESENSTEQANTSESTEVETSGVDTSELLAEVKDIRQDMTVLTSASLVEMTCTGLLVGVVAACIFARYMHS